jgi:IS5 family transposase
MAPSPLLPKRNGAIVLRTKVDPQPTLWEAILPPEFSPGLARIDRLLDDPVFFEPFAPFFSPDVGRPSIPIETYLRMMFLRFRYRLGFETLCGEVTDSLTWRRFCRIGLTDSVPDPSTLMKITTRCGETTVSALNQRLLEKANAAHLIKMDKVRADTTVIPANVAYPTDSGLLAKGVAKLTKTVGAIKAAGLARRTRFRDRTRSVRKRAHQIAAWLRRRSGEAKDEVLTLTGELATIAEATIKEAQNVAINARRGLRRVGARSSGKAASLVTELERTIGVLEAIVAQTRTRLAGEVPDGATRVVSLHDTEARPIAKGRLGRPVEFGFKGQVVDNTDGVVLDHCVEMGNPHDARMLAPAIARIKKPLRQGAQECHRRPGLWRGQSGGRAAFARGHVCGHPEEGSSRCATTSTRVFTPLPKTGQVAHRIRGSHLLSQALVGMGAHPARWDRRRPYLVRLGHLGPQRHQDRRARRGARNEEHCRHYGRESIHDHQKTIRAPPTIAREDSRLIPLRSSPVAPRTRKHRENGVKSDRRGLSGSA